MVWIVGYSRMPTAEKGFGHCAVSLARVFPSVDVEGGGLRKAYVTPPPRGNLLVERTPSFRDGLPPPLGGREPPRSASSHHKAPGRRSPFRETRSFGTVLTQPRRPSGPGSRSLPRLASSPFVTMLECPPSPKRIAPPGRGASLRSAPLSLFLRGEIPEGSAHFCANARGPCGAASTPAGL